MTAPHSGRARSRSEVLEARVRELEAQVALLQQQVEEQPTADSSPRATTEIAMPTRDGASDRAPAWRRLAARAADAVHNDDPFAERTNDWDDDFYDGLRAALEPAPDDSGAKTTAPRRPRVAPRRADWRDVVVSARALANFLSRRR